MEKQVYIDEVKSLQLADKFEEADKLCDEARLYYADDLDLKELQRQIHDKLTLIRFPKSTYIDWLLWFHNVINPRCYVEIGVESGKSLTLAKKNTRAIGIDPEPKIVYGIQSDASIYKTTSDKFFEENNLYDILGGKVDLAFIDGLHYYDQVIRDFLNIEKYSKKNTVVLFHDVYPAIPATATREWNTVYWAGDTWKAFHALSKYRPDLKILTIPAYPTGLGVITDLNPYADDIDINKITEEYRHLSYDIDNSINLVENNFDIVKGLLSL